MQDNVLRKIVHEYQDTPMYIFDLDMLEKRISRITEMIPANMEICYAIKANPFLVRAIDRQIAKYEVCSPGELHICKKLKISGKKIVYSGVNKGKADIEEAMEYGAETLTAESVKQFQMIEECARQREQFVNVLPRLTNGSQFGMDQGDLEEIIKNRDKFPYIKVIGIQFFSGTQKKKEKKYEEIQFLKEYCKRLEQEYGFNPEVVEYGPGMAFSYFEGDKSSNDFAELEELALCIRETEMQVGWVIELGRYIAAECGYYVTQIVDTKKNHGKNYCIVDGGINHINYYGQNMAMRIPQISHICGRKERDAQNEEWSVCGSLCTFADVVVRKLCLKDLQDGDTLVFHNIGAYAVTEGIYLFLSRSMPAIYFYSMNSGMTLVRDRLETSGINSENK